MSTFVDAAVLPLPLHPVSVSARLSLLASLLRLDLLPHDRVHSLLPPALEILMNIPPSRQSLAFLGLALSLAQPFALDEAAVSHVLSEPLAPPSSVLLQTEGDESEGFVRLASTLLSRALGADLPLVEIPVRGVALTRAGSLNPRTRHIMSPQHHLDPVRYFEVKTKEPDRGETASKAKKFFSAERLSILFFERSESTISALREARPSLPFFFLLILLRIAP